MRDSLILKNLKEALQVTLSTYQDEGRKAQLLMSHTGRRFEPQADENPKDAAVLHYLYPKDGEYYFVLIERNSRFPNDKHKGQIALAGGAFEREDTDMEATARREFYEELGVAVDSKEILTSLEPLYIPVSQFRVHSFLAISDQKPIFVAQPDEVARVIEVPLRMLVDNSSKHYENMKINQKYVLERVPQYHFFGYKVWGATAMMLSELEAIIKKTGYIS